jgi:hypothetical protein
MTLRIITLSFLGLALASCAASQRHQEQQVPPPPLTLEQGRYILRHWYIEQF